jgi:hypothetical protein
MKRPPRRNYPDARLSPFLWLILCIVLLLVGINLGEVPSVLEKATRICLSCMGIG